MLGFPRHWFLLLKIRTLQFICIHQRLKNNFGNTQHIRPRDTQSFQIPLSFSCDQNGGRGSVVSASEFKPEDPGIDPFTGQGEDQFFYPFNSCVDLFVPDSPLCVWHAPKICAHIKEPTSICRKRVGFTAKW